MLSSESATSPHPTSPWPGGGDARRGLEASEPELSDEDVIQSFAFRRRQLVSALVFGSQAPEDERAGRLGRGFLAGAAVAIAIAMAIGIVNLAQVASARMARERAQPAVHVPAPTPVSFSPR